MSEATEAIAAFFVQYPKISYKKGDRVLLPCEQVDSLYFIISGIVRQYDIGDNGEELTVNAYKTGSFFPLSLAFHNIPNRYHFECVDEVSIHKAPASDVRDFLQTNQHAAYATLTRIVSGLEGATLRMRHLMGGTAQTKIVFELLLWARRFSSNNIGNSIDVAMTQQDIANQTGLTRETVNRELAKLKKQGLIEPQHAHITIADPDHLARLIQ